MKSIPFEMLEQAVTEEQLIQLQMIVNTEGHSSFYRLLNGFTARIKSFTDPEEHEVRSLLDKAKRLFPTPVLFSPSWDKVWNELEQIITHKAKILQSVPPEERDGEWQIVMDNPATIQDVVCYPGLAFLDAVYLFAYFRPQMEKNEYLRLQKVQTLFMQLGSDA
ncbi:hypothetical protein [Paenibacillus sp. GP183]|uniref:hypothetical protein n=1 Tax=Paenibacillus sp. GP183 TaxID=1882751 RepID=UPI000899B69E|nr:hypothetical protein [Paenibacillus sp. GP183]SEC26680.1 hypothetical protein SAMN05443246_3527 [Paenibacillus sp. GP183]